MPVGATGGAAAQSRQSRRSTGRAVLAALIALSAWGAGAGGQEVESRRFDNQTFYDGLIELGLLDLLDEHLATNPPKDPLTRLMLERKIKLVVWQNESVGRDRRQAALAGANEILRQLIREHSSDERALEWQLELARSLIYEQAEPYYANILYRGGSVDDRRHLREITDQVGSVLEQLKAFLESEYARIDEVSLAEYERLDNNGYVESLEKAMPKADYMLLWANFYAALAREDNDPARNRLLEQVMSQLTEGSALLTTEHALSHVQAQSLLLAGMASRRLANPEAADRYLSDAASVTTSLTDPVERRDLQWIVLLATVERVRALRDAGRYDAALSVLADLRRLVQSGDQDFGRELVVTMLESSVHQHRATRRSDDNPLGAALTDEAARPLMDLARKQPAYRDEVYATIYEQVRRLPEATALHPLQQCALLAGMIGDATRLRQGVGVDTSRPDAQKQADADAMALLDRAINLATNLVGRLGEDPANPYRCEALYNLGVAHHLHGQRVEAIERFMDVARSCPAFNRALAAATYAVELAAEIAGDPSLAGRRQVRTLLVDALRTLVDGFPDSDAVRYWRFFYAQALEGEGERIDAAAQYGQIERNHPHFLVARFRSGRCLALDLMDFAAAQPGETAEILRRAQDAQKALDRFRELADREVGEDAEMLAAATAEAEVLAAEIDVLPGVDRAEPALSRLAGFEERHAGQQDLIGRVLRVRIIAYQATDQLAEAEQAVPGYIASAPDQAGATLQGLFDATWAEVERYRQRGASEQAALKARSALLFAEQLYAWAASAAQNAPPKDLHALRLQLAEAHVEAGNAEQALKLLDETAAFDAKRQPDGQVHDPRILLAQARALALQRRWSEALPVFNRVFREAPVGAQYRFTALLGDLACRTELGEPAEQIVNIIRQQRFLEPDLGGEHLKAQFAALQARNEARMKP